MEYVFQFCIIAAVSFAGELLSLLLPLPVPGSVYGLVLLLAGLCTGLIKLHQVEKAGDFLVRIMPVLFLGPCVSILAVAGSIASSLVGILVLCMVSTLLVMAVTGLTAQRILRRKEKEHHE
jgi:holin-like protein